MRPTPVPPLNGLRCHVIFAWSPTGHSQSGASVLVLQVLLQHATCLFASPVRCLVVYIQQICVVGVTSLIVGFDGAVVGVGIGEFIFLDLSIRKSLDRLVRATLTRIHTGFSIVVSNVSGQ